MGSEGEAVMSWRSLAFILALTIGLIAAASASAAVNAHLTGKFAMKVTFTQSSFDPGSVGTVAERGYRFVPECEPRGSRLRARRACCRRGPCEAVWLWREAAGGSSFVSLLRRTGRGIYEGTEGPASTSCPGKTKGTGDYTFQHHIEIVKKTRRPIRRKGRVAKKIKGHSEYANPDCDATQAITYAGRLDR
jgi:hypothetical protein